VHPAHKRTSISGADLSKASSCSCAMCECKRQADPRKVQDLHPARQLPPVCARLGSHKSLEFVWPRPCAAINHEEATRREASFYSATQPTLKPRPPTKPAEDMGARRNQPRGRHGWTFT